MKYDIFISYRRDGGFELAKHIYDLLKKDGYSVSFDMETLRSGNFNTELLKRIDECNDFLVILNKGAFDRCFTTDKSNDWLRTELSYALEKGKNIIPVMLEGFEFPNNLPEDIAEITVKNGPKYDKYYFDNFYQRLKDKFLLTKQKTVSKQIIIILISIFVVALALGLFFLLNKNKDDITEQHAFPLPDIEVAKDTIPQATVKEEKNGVVKDKKEKEKEKETKVTAKETKTTVKETDNATKKTEPAATKIEEPKPAAAPAAPAQETPIKDPEPPRSPLLSATDYNGVPSGRTEVQFIKNLSVQLTLKNDSVINTTLQKGEFLNGDWDNGRFVGNGELKRNNFEKIKNIKKIVVR